MPKNSNLAKSSSVCGERSWEGVIMVISLLILMMMSPWLYSIISFNFHHNPVEVDIIIPYFPGEETVIKKKKRPSNC